MEPIRVVRRLSVEPNRPEGGSACWAGGVMQTSPQPAGLRPQDASYTFWRPGLPIAGAIRSAWHSMAAPPHRRRSDQRRIYAKTGCKPATPCQAANAGLYLKGTIWTRYITVQEQRQKCLRLGLRCARSAGEFSWHWARRVRQSGVDGCSITWLSCTAGGGRLGRSDAGFRPNGGPGTRCRWPQTENELAVGIELKVTRPGIPRGERAARRCAACPGKPSSASEQ